MRKILLILSVLFSFVVSAQKLQFVNTYGYDYNKFKARDLMGLPSDTFTVPSTLLDVKWMANKYNVLYTWDTASHYWRIYLPGTVSTVAPQTKLLSGGSVSWKGVGYQFFIQEATYVIEDIPYSSDSISITLSAADPTDPRKDVIYLGTDGAVHVLEGDPAPAAAEPQLDADQIKLTVIDIPAGSTVPTLTQETIYNENIEWTVSQVSVFTLDPDNLTNVWIGSKSMNVTNINHNDQILLTKALGTVNTDDYRSLQLSVKLKAVMVAAANISITFFYDALQVSNEINVPLNKSSLVYQAISIPLQNFTFGNTNVNRVRIRYRNTASTANHTGFYLDYINLIEGFTQPGGGSADVSLTLSMPSGFSVSPPTIVNNGTWNVTGAGSTSQYIDGTGALRTFSAWNTQGAIDGVAKTAYGFGVSGNIFYQQYADATYPGIVSAYDWRRFDSAALRTVENGLGGDTLAVYVDEFTTKIKALKAGSNITFTIGEDSIVINSTGGSGTQTLQQTFDQEVGGSVLTKNDSIIGNAFRLNIYSTTNWPLNLSSDSSNALRASTKHPTASLAIFTKTSTATSTVFPDFRIQNFTTGTAANGFGTGLEVSLESAAGLSRLGSDIQTYWNDATDISRTSYIRIRGSNNAATDTFMTIQPSGVILVNNDDDTLATKAYARSVGGGSADGNGIYTGSGSLSGATTVTQGGNDITFTGGDVIVDAVIGNSTSTSGTGINANGVYDIRRTITAAGNHRGFLDATYFSNSTVSNHSYAAFDVKDTIDVASGSTSDHAISFQARTLKVGDGTLTHLYNFANATPKISAGTVTNTYGLYYFNPTISGTGALTNQWGVYVPSLTSATNNYGAYFENNVGIGTSTPATKLHVAGSLRFVTGNQGANELLVSDGSGNADWTPGTSSLVGLGNVDNTSNATERAATATLTNKRITKRVGTIASSATPTPDGDANDMFTVTALAVGAVFAAPTGTPTDGQGLIIRIKDNGGSQTLGFNAIYRAGTDIALPTATVVSKTMYLGFIYNSADSKWDLVSKSDGY